MESLTGSNNQAMFTKVTGVEGVYLKISSFLSFKEFDSLRVAARVNTAISEEFLLKVFSKEGLIEEAIKAGKVRILKSIAPHVNFKEKGVIYKRLAEGKPYVLEFLEDEGVN